MEEDYEHYTNEFGKQSRTNLRKTTVNKEHFSCGINMHAYICIVPQPLTFIVSG